MATADAQVFREEGDLKGKLHGRYSSRVSIEPDIAAEVVDRLAPMVRASIAKEGGLKILSFDDSQPVRELLAMPHAQEIAKESISTRNQAVFCGLKPLWLKTNPLLNSKRVAASVRQEIRGFISEHGESPRVIIVPGLGMFTAGETFTAAKRAREVFTENNFSGLVPGGPPKADEVLSMRPKQKGYSVLPGRMEGKVAIVTGAAQGFGEGIARLLAKQGAHVLIGDIQYEKASAVAGEICSDARSNIAGAIKMDVTDPASVRNAVHEAVRLYGGVDLFVSNAGILRAGALKDVPVEPFELVLKVNLTGLFLCAQAVAPIMERQHMADDACRGDIMAISSKSGLQGSAKNSAYAASKFGEIGLVQSLAKELVDSGIKVNAVCPGNYLDGPLWSDPENGLFVQYLRAKKVPGAKTVDDVRKFYEAQVPMRRGCAPEDVVTTILYIVDQTYESGWAYGVTGGQVMR